MRRLFQRFFERVVLNAGKNVMFSNLDEVESGRCAE